ncbi:HNH endonuclease signature motif containing protein [soil metagenome]
MSELRSAVDGLRAEDLGHLSDEALEEDLAECQRAAEVLEAERLRRLAEFDRRRPYLRDGYLSTSTWFARRFRVGFGAAAGDVRRARALEAMPRTREALATGQISSSAARMLVEARETNPQAFAEAEPLLEDAARRHSVRDLARVLAYWRSAAAADHEPGGDEQGLRERRRLHVSPTVFGLVRIDGDLDPDTGETVLTTLRACVDAELRSPDPEDRRTPAQRRADALGEICRRWLDSGDRPEIRGERPHVTLTADVQALGGNRGGHSELEHVGPIGVETARLWACDAVVTRVLTMGRSEPLDVGRRTSVVPAPMRRAVIVRDGGCRFPGCDRPPPWCDAHHVVHWADGGPTALANLLLLCRRHHRLVHQGFRMEMTRDGPIFRRRDGTILEGRDDPRGPGVTMDADAARRCALAGAG